MKPNEFSNIIASQFSITQVGYVSNYIEPISCFYSLEEARDIFDNNDKATSLPIERDGGVIGLVSRETIMQKCKSKWESFKGSSLDKYLERDVLILNAEENASKALEYILTHHEGHVFADFLIYNHGKFFAIGTFLDLSKHVAFLQKNDLEMARDIQQYLMYKNKAEEGNFTVKTYIKMAHELGGDFYQFLKLKDNLYMISSFDVSGKNISASLSTCMISSFFNTLELSEKLSSYSPAQLLKLFNEFAIQQTPQDVFIAGAFFFVDDLNKKIDLYNFGYTPVYTFLIDNEGNKVCKILKPNLSPLGIKKIENIEGSSKVFPVSKGLRFFVYSDGLVEAKDMYGEMYGYERLKKFLTDHHNEGVDGLLNKLEETITAFIGEAPQADDITSFILQF